VPRCAILGGTGAQGLGIALRLAATGEAIAIGSRVAERALGAADEIRRRVPGADVVGLDNESAARSGDRVVLAFPASGIVPALAVLGPVLAGKLVVDVMVSLAFHRGRADIVPVEGAASVGELVQRAAPGARVVSALKNVSAELLQDLSRPLEGDVLICGDDPSARSEAASLVVRLAALRAVDAGALANARYVEGITALLVNLNRQHRARTSISIVGLPR
jgi:NADPH-dependent F420 reductase